MTGYRRLVAQHYKTNRHEVQLDVKVRSIFDELRERDIQMQQEVFDTQKQKEFELDRLNKKLLLSERHAQHEAEMAVKASLESQKTIEQVLINVSQQQYSANVEMDQRVHKVIERMIESKYFEHTFGGDWKNVKKMFNPKKALTNIRASMDATAMQGIQNDPLAMIKTIKDKDRAKDEKREEEEKAKRAKEEEEAKQAAKMKQEMTNSEQAQDVNSLKKLLSDAEREALLEDAKKTLRAEDRAQAKQWHNKYCALAEYDKDLKMQHEKLRSELQDAEDRAEEMEKAQQAEMEEILKAKEQAGADAANASTQNRQAHQARLMEALEGKRRLQAANERNRKLIEEKSVAEAQAKELGNKLKAQAEELEKEQHKVQAEIEKKAMAKEELGEVLRELDEKQTWSGAKNTFDQAKMHREFGKLKRQSVAEVKLRVAAEAENKELKDVQLQAHQASAYAAKLTGQQAFKIVELQNALEAMTQKYNAEKVRRQEAQSVSQGAEERLQAEMESLRKEGELKAEAVKRAQQLKDANIQITQQLAEENRARKAWQTKALKLEKDMEEATKKISTLTEQKTFVEEELEQMEIEMRNWRKAKEGEELLHHRTKKELQLTREELRSAKSANSSYVQQLGENKEKIRVLEEEENLLKSNLDDEERQLVAQEEARKRLEEEVEAYVQTLGDERQKKEALARSEEALKIDLSQANAAIENYAKTQTELQEQITKVTEERDQLAEEMQQAEKGRTATSRMLSAVKLKNKELRQSIRLTEKQRENMEQQTGFQEGLIEEKEIEIQRLLEMIEEHEDKIGALERALQEYKDALETEEDMRAQTQQSLETFKRKSMYAEEDAQRRAEAEEKVTEKERELEQAKRQIDENLNQVTNHAERVGALEAELNTMTSKLTSVTRKSVHQTQMIKMMSEKEVQRAQEALEAEKELQEVLEAAERYKEEHGELSEEAQHQLELIDHQSKHIKGLEKELSMCVEEMGKLDKMLTKEKSKNQILVEKQADFSVQLKEAQDAKAAAEAAREQMEEKLDDAQHHQKHLEARHAHHDEVKNEHGVEIQMLHDQIAMMKKAHEEEVEKRMHRERSRNHKHNTVSELQEDLRIEMERSGAIEEDNVFLKKELEQLEKQVHVLSEEDDTQKQHIKELEIYCDELEATQDAEEKARKKAEKGLKQAEEKLAEAQANVERLEKETAKLQNASEEIKQVELKLRDELVAHFAQAARQSAKISHLEKDIDELNKQIEEREKRLEAAAEAHKDLEIQLNSERSALEATENELIALKRETKEWRAQKKEMQELIEFYESERDELKRQEKEWHHYADELEEQAEFLRKEKNKADKAKREAQEQLHEAKETIEHAAAIREEDKRLHEEVLHMKHALQEEAEEHKRLAETQKDEIHRLQHQVIPELYRKLEEEQKHSIVEKQRAHQLEIMVRELELDVQQAKAACVEKEKAVEKMKSELKREEERMRKKLQEQKEKFEQQMEEEKNHEHELEEVVHDYETKLAESEMGRAALIERCKVEEEKRIIAENWRDADQNFDHLKLEREVARLRRARIEEAHKFQAEKLKILEDERKEIERKARRESMSIVQSLQQELVATQRQQEEQLRGLQQSIEEKVRAGDPITMDLLTRAFSEARRA